MIAELRQVLPLRLQVSTLFLFLMWLFFQVYQPWLPIDEDILHNTGAFDNVTDLSDWKRERGEIAWSDDTGFVSLKPGARLRLQLPAFAGDLLLCSGRIKTIGVRPGKQQYDAGRILVYFEDVKGNVHWSHPHNVGYLSGDSGWQHFTTMIEVPQFAHKGWVELANYGVSGTVEFDDVAVRPASWKETYSHWKLFFGMSWAAIMMALVLNSHFWTLRWGRWALASGVLIVIGVTLPPATMFEVASSGARFSQKVFDSAEEVLPANVLTQPATRVKAVPLPDSGGNATGKQQPQSSVISKATSQQLPGPVSRLDIQKLGHSLLFASLGLFAFLAFYQQISTGLLAYSLLLFAVSTEILQLAVEGRLFGMHDLLLDVAGIVTGCFIAWLIARMRTGM